MQKRFASDPLFQATLLLLQERIPRASAFYFHSAELTGLQTGAGTPQMPIRVLDSPDTPVPEVQLLSNGRYHVMVTNAGGGYSRWKDLAVTRWREDCTRDPWGTSVTCATRRAAPSGPPPTSPACVARTATKRSSRKGARNFAAATAISIPIPRSSYRRKTTSSCAGCASPTVPPRAGASRSRATRRWCWRPPPPTPCIRHSAISSCRPRSSTRTGPSSAPAGPAPATSTRPGCST